MNNILTPTQLKKDLENLSNKYITSALDECNELVTEWFREDVTISCFPETSPEISDERFGMYILEKDGESKTPFQIDSIGKLLNPINQELYKDFESRYKSACKKEIIKKLHEFVNLNDTIYDLNIDSPIDYKTLKQLKQERAELIENIVNLYYEAKGIEYDNTNENKKILEMTKKDLKDLLKDVKGNHPQETQIICNNNAPSDCTLAIDKVLMHTYTVKNVVMNPRQQIMKAADIIDLTSGSQTAMLMSICQEVGAIKQGVNCRDFVRSLIGLGLIPYSDKVVNTMADGMNKKLNSSLDPNHLRWTSRDRLIGNKIYEKMTKQG